MIGLNRTLGRRLRGPALTLAAVVALAPCAWAADDDAKLILKKMSDYLDSQKTISVAMDTSIEVMTPDLEKIQFTSSGQLLLNRPDKLRAHRVGGYADVELVFDGKTVTVYGKNLNAFAQMEAAGSTDQLIGHLRNDFGIEAPGADLLLSNANDVLSDGVLEAKHIGRGVINGVECDHLAFRNADTDWQLWVEAGPQPIPRKYVITTKTLTGAPQYTLVIKDWQTNPNISADSFAFTPPAGAQKKDVKELSGIDEVPLGTAK